MTILWWIRLACIVYIPVMTVLLLAPDPASLIGLTEIPEPLEGRAVHFSFFVLLAILARASRWSMRGWVLGACLVSYAFAMELLQSAVPPRTVELADLLENLLGLGAGALLWRFIGRRPAGHRPSASEPSTPTLPGSDTRESSSADS